MAKLIEKINHILETEFQGASVELEKSGSNKIAGVVFWAKFERMEQIERQEQLWNVLEKNLTKKELLHITAILTMTPNENPVPSRSH